MCFEHAAQFVEAALAEADEFLTEFVPPAIEKDRCLEQAFFLQVMQHIELLHGNAHLIAVCVVEVEQVANAFRFNVRCQLELDVREVLFVLSTLLAKGVVVFQPALQFEDVDFQVLVNFVVKWQTSCEKEDQKQWIIQT